MPAEIHENNCWEKVPTTRKSRTHIQNSGPSKWGSLENKVGVKRETTNKKKRIKNSVGGKRRMRGPGQKSGKKQF